jgi:hypothetical protein
VRHPPAGGTQPPFIAGPLGGIAWHPARYRAKNLSLAVYIVTIKYLLSIESGLVFYNLPANNIGLPLE